MRFIKLFKYFIAGCIGYFVSYDMYVLAAYSFFKHGASNLDYAQLHQYQMLYPILLWCIFIFGFSLGVIVGKKKGKIYEIFKVGKTNVLLTVLVSFAVLPLQYGSSIKHYLYFEPLQLCMSFVTFLFLFYPFCSVIIRWILSFRKIKISFVLCAFLVILLNPLFVLAAIRQESIFRHKIYNKPCGVRIVGFSEESPAKHSGLEEGDIIVRIGEETLNRKIEIVEYMRTLNVQDDIVLYTTDGMYEIKLAGEESSSNSNLGIYLEQWYCSEN